VRRRTYRSPMSPRPQRRPIAVAVAARPVPALRWVVLLALALLLALVLPRIAAAAPTLELGRDAAVVRVDAPAEAEVQVVWGLAPNAGRVVRSTGGAHAVALRGLKPGRIYVYRVYVNGAPVTGPVPFRTPGAAPGATPVHL